MRYLIEMELEIADSRRSSSDTRARALKVGESIAAWAARLRHARVLWAQLEHPHGQITKLIEESQLQTVDYGRLGADEGGGDAETP